MEIMVQITTITGLDSRHPNAVTERSIVIISAFAHTMLLHMNIYW